MKQIKFRKKTTDSIESDRLLLIVIGLLKAYSVVFEGSNTNDGVLEINILSRIDADFLLLHMDIECLGFDCSIEK